MSIDSQSIKKSTGSEFTREEICDFVHWFCNCNIQRKIEEALWWTLTMKEQQRLWIVNDACDYTLEALKKVLWKREVIE